jgi:hypothetical protein
MRQCGIQARTIWPSALAAAARISVASSRMNRGPPLRSVPGRRRDAPCRSRAPVCRPGSTLRFFILHTGDVELQRLSGIPEQGASQLLRGGATGAHLDAAGAHQCHSSGASGHRNLAQGSTRTALWFIAVHSGVADQAHSRDEWLICPVMQGPAAACRIVAVAVS